MADSTTFILTVSAVNDQPNEFSAIYPTVSDTFNINVDNDSTIIFIWEESTDVDSDVIYKLIIFLEFFGNYYSDIYDNITDTTTSVLSNSLLPILNVISQDEATFTYYIHAMDEEYTTSDVGEFVLNNITLSTNEYANIPNNFILYQNFPNPFNPITKLRYNLPSDALVTLSIYDMLGREITQLVNISQEAGFKSVQWDATDSMGRPVSAGVYLYQIEAGEFVQTKKMVLLK